MATSETRKIKKSKSTKGTDSTTKPADQSKVITPKDITPQIILTTPVENRSSVDIKQTAKGDSQVEIKVYQNTTPEEMQRLADIAVKVYRRTCTRLAQAHEER